MAAALGPLGKGVTLLNAFVNCVFIKVVGFEDVNREDAGPTRFERLLPLRWVEEVVADYFEVLEEEVVEEVVVLGLERR